MFSAILQAIVQGFTEFLPVSSSGHLFLVQSLTGFNESGGLFALMLHLGTLGAVFIAFHKLIGQLIVEFVRMLGLIFTGKFKWKNRSPEQNMLVMLIISTIVLVPVYFVGHKWLKAMSDPKTGSLLFVGVCFLITAVILFIGDRCVKSKKGIGDIKPKHALLVGLFQCVALLPGISRSGSTITGGLISGMNRETAVQYSFILGIPAILGGALSEIGSASTADIADIGGWGIVALGIVISLIVGILSIYMVRLIVKKEKFTIFSIYLLAIGIFTIVIGVVGK